MDALKKFLTKKKADKKFKDAGPGHRLTESSGSSSAGGSSGSRATPPKKPSQRVGPTGERKAAVDAALARLEQKKSATNPNELLANRQLKFIREQARKEIEAEKRQDEAGNEASKPTTTNVHDEPGAYTMEAESGNSVDPKYFAVNGVFFTCPIVGPTVASRAEIEEDIYNFLMAQLSEDMVITSCLLIHSCNRGREKVQGCVETLCKYLDNIINNPSEIKYRKIRSSNKVFQEKVVCVRGALEFLEAAGFSKAMLKPDATTESVEEEFWVYAPGEDVEEDGASLTELRDTLQSTTPIRPELDRNIQVLMPAQVVSRKELPADFYALTGEELKREQRIRSEIAERETRLRTKAQRDRDELREQRLYKFCLMRIRFPDGFTLQGTFRASEKLGDVYAFVQECLAMEDAVFCLKKSGGGGETLSDLEASLAEMRLAPASVLNFKLESDLPATAELAFLRPELLALVQHME